MRPLAILVMLLWALNSEAQNYQCLQGGVKQFYTNSNGYLRSINANSTLRGSDSVFSNFCTLRGPYYAVSGRHIPGHHGGSWIGDSVIMQNDGRFLFFNSWGDTIIIKSRANTGDNWMFYNDTGIYSYQATVVSIDTMTILDSLDSVKTIQINAYLSGIHNPSDSLDGFKIKLSKKYGLVQLFDLYTFPYHFPVYPDFFYQNVGYYFADQIFYPVRYAHPQHLEIFDFAPGDVFERKTTTSLPWTYPCVGTDYRDLSIDSIASKTIIDPTHVKYTMHRTGYYSSTSGLTYYDSMATIIVSTEKLFGTILNPDPIPEKCDDYMSYYLQPDDTNWCIPSPLYTTVGTGFCGGYDPPYCTGEESFKKGLGQVRKVTVVDGKDGCDGAIIAIMHTNLVFVVKNGDSCGSFVPLTSTATAGNARKNPDYHVFPNPASQELNVQINSTFSGAITLSLQNMQGQNILSQTTTAKQETINVNTLADGLYFLVLTDETGLRYRTKIMINH